MPPGPPEIVLHQFARGEGQDSGSAFCTKAQRTLTFKGLAYRTHTVVSPFALKRLNPGVGKVPVLEYDGTLVPDSTAIARFLDGRHPDPPLWPTDARRRAEAHLLEDWADESLYWFVVYHRWQLDETFWPFAARTFGFVPALVRPLAVRAARRTALAQLRGQGIGRLTPDAVQGLLEGHLAALETLLEEREWLVGDAPTLADVAVFATVQGLHSPGLPRTRRLVDERPGLVAWARRVDERTRGEHTVAWA